MIVRGGIKYAGEVDQIDQESVVTKCIYVASIFIPIGSYYSFGETTYGFKGFKIKPNLKSLLNIFLFSGLLTVSLAIILIAICTMNILAIAVCGMFGAWGIALAFGAKSLGRLTEKEKCRRRVLMDVVGMGVHPRYLYKKMAQDILNRLEERWRQATANTPYQDWRQIESLDILSVDLLKLLFCLALYDKNKPLANRAWLWMDDPETARKSQLTQKQEIKQNSSFGPNPVPDLVIMDISHICINCFAEKETAEACPKCGFNENDRHDQPQFLPPGTILKGQYLVGKLLDYNGLDNTYLAFDLKLQVKVMIKEYFPVWLAERTLEQTELSLRKAELQNDFMAGLDNFIVIARKLAELNRYTCISTVLDVFKENNTAYFVMEFDSMISLKEYLSQAGGKITYDKALMFMIPVMDALKAAHGNFLLHGAVNPNNLYITSEEKVLLLDFQALFYYMQDRSHLPVILLPGFAPWEQCYSKGVQGPWTDVYSVAATIYRAITGITPPDAIDRMAEDDLQPPSALGIQLPDGVEEALLKALSLKAQNRFETMAEFQAALEGESKELYQSLRDEDCTSTS